jgi:hypothetical protein
METIKPLEEILVPDPRSTIWVMVSRTTGQPRPITLEDHYRRFSRVKLNATVPEHVQSGVATAANLFLYGWFNYSFGQVAELHCLATLELALRVRLKELGEGKTRGLHKLMSKAVESGLLTDAGLPPEPIDLAAGSAPDAGEPPQSIHQGTDPDPARRVKYLTHSLPDWRNVIAHGSFTLFPPGNYMLMLVAALINQLWPDSGTKP